MVIKKSFGETCFDIANAAIMILLMILTIYPLLYIAFASISNPTWVIAQRGLILWPHDFYAGAYERVFANPMIPIGYRNTLFYVIAGTTINIILTSFGAYGLSRKGLMLRNQIVFFITFTMFFHGGLIPSYLLVKGLHLDDKVWALIIPGAVSTWNLIVMRTSFQGIPDSMEESAKIDGAHDFTILFKIILPLSLPVIAVMVLFYGVGHWNAWFNAMIYLRERNLFPLQLILREILIQSSMNEMMANTSAGDQEPIGETIKYATIMVATIPILFAYPFLQKYFVKGVMIGAIKE